MTKKENSIHPNDRQEFQDICSNMCKVGTVQEFIQLQERLQDISTRNSGNLDGSIAWWDVRKENLFPAFTGTRTPGVNLAEMGNAGWTKRNSSKIVRAAFEDAASMVLQNVQIRLFLSNEGKSSGRGPTEEERNRCEHKQQRREAAGYIDVLDSIEHLSHRFESGDAVTAQDVLDVAQEFGPMRGSFHSSGSAKHKPPANSSRGVQGAFEKPKKKTVRNQRYNSTGFAPTLPQPLQLVQNGSQHSQFSESGDIELMQAAAALEENNEEIFKTLNQPMRDIQPLVSKRGRKAFTHGRGRGRRGTARGSVKYRQATMDPDQFNEALLDETVRRNIHSAENLLGRRVPPRLPVTRGSSLPNHFIMFRCKDVPNISRCFGCKTPIRKGELAPPEDFVVRRKGDRQQLNQRTQQWFTASNQHLYFHADRKCLERYDGTFEIRDLHMKDEVFGELDEGRMNWLKEQGFLGQLVAIAKGRLE